MKDLPGFRRRLLRWFRANKRPLPWRRTRDWWPVWISETMLQQTTVVTVIPYFERFLKRFPTVRHLADAPEEDVVALWSGLGYYSRARNLRAAARQIVHDYDGDFPRDPQVARALKGVGPYTANAVTSIACGVPAAVVDGNVRRVLSRLLARRAVSPALDQADADRLLSRNAPGDWNEAMMELGATICTPLSPACSQCPVRKDCRGQKDPGRWSRKAPATTPKPSPMILAFVQRGSRVLLVRNPEGGLMGGLLDLPRTAIPSAPAPSLEDRFPEAFTLAPAPVAKIRHAVTRYRIAAEIFPAKLRPSARVPAAEWREIDGLEALALSGLTRKALRALKVLQL